jgi:hypothetical protein
MIINVEILLEKHQNLVIGWHQEIVLNETELFWSFVEENMKWNFMLWHEEDIARIKDIDPLRIVEAKRNIDQYNQARNNAMEKIDEWILSYLESKQILPGQKIHSETPGMMIDRLAIMALKKYHMDEETMRSDVDQAHIEKCALKVAVLNEQIKDLSNALNQVFVDLENSILRFKVYRQFKMYNDPSLNPELYKRNNSK